jgi:uncharacterized protein (TIGR00255 family)
MSIKSMTGFARAEGRAGNHAWHWELRSVNARGLDVRSRLPAGSEALEPQVRDAAARHLTRGSVTIGLSTSGREGSLEIRLNEAALMQVVKATEHIRQLTGADPPRADGLIAIKGVLEVLEKEESADEKTARATAMLASLEEALRALVQSRATEGARLQTVLADSLNEIERLLAIAETSPARTPAAIEKRLKDQLARLLDPSNGFDAARLHQEAVLLATRVDIEEEIKRLKAHIGAARELLQEEGAVGRKLDFLAQEFNREANTLCAKANDVEITRAGLAMKTVIDQMREQVQNIE